MKYITIGACDQCRHWYLYDGIGYCSALDGDGPDGTGKPTQGDAEPPGWCPLSDLPEWRMLAEGEVIREGDEDYDEQEGGWVKTANADRVIAGAWWMPVRRRLRGAE